MCEIFVHKILYLSQWNMFSAKIMHGIGMELTETLI